MLEVSRSRRIAATPAAIFALLSDPQNLVGLLPRVERIDVLEQSQGRARVATHMSFGPFGSIRNEGDVQWVGNSELVFRTTSPVPVESRWVLLPASNATDVTVSLRLDLAPLLGPLAAFVPPEQVAKVVAPDLDGALDAIARRLAGG